MTTPEPGWYPDPTDAAQQRWWDGAAWTSESLPVPAPPASPPAPSRSRAKIPIWVWLLIGAVGILAVIFLSQAVAAIALVALITGIVALAKGTPTWLRLRTRNSAVVVTVASAVMLLVSSSVGAAMLPRDASAQVESVTFTGTSGSENPAAAATRTPSPTRTPVTTTRQDVMTEPVAFEKVTVEDAAQPSGQTQVTTTGQNGTRTLTYVVTLVDGKETARELTSDVVTVAPIAEVTTIGTYVAPPPAPAVPDTSGCDPNYADACVPIASDVDCAGGGGNGPAYFDGVARVVGSDIYQLDRDGDGYACES